MNTNTILLLGATGMLGQALVTEGCRLGLHIVGAARSGSDRKVDLRDPEAIADLVRQVSPDLIINTAAMTDIVSCEADPVAANAINALAVTELARAATAVKSRLIHVSTDHFYTGDGDKIHSETAPVVLLNEYARTKYVGETLALSVPGALVVRTNIAGVRGWAERPTFVEWAVHALVNREPLTFFSDFVTSTIDSSSLAEAIFSLAGIDASGILNVAAHEPADKATFLRAFASKLGIDAGWASEGSVAGLRPIRAESLGLDVGRAETLLGRELPDLDTVLERLAIQVRRAGLI
jgi:dTDP-4-dehydrorhamnose reductase